MKIMDGVLIEVDQEDIVKGKLIIPNDVMIIGECVLEGNEELVEVIISDSVISIEENAFMECIELQYIDLGNSLVKIGPSAFSNCINLKNLNMPDSLKMISRCAFSGCVSLMKAEIPDNVVYVGESVYDDCNNLEYINWHGKVNVVEMINGYCVQKADIKKEAQNISLTRYQCFATNKEIYEAKHNEKKAYGENSEQAVRELSIAI